MKTLLLSVLLLFACTAITAQQPAAKPAYTYKIITANGTYGYDIYANKKMLVHQPSVPGMPGNKGFALRKDAVAVAKLVIKKLEQGVMPPTTLKQELEELKVLHD
ncbi:DUF4907 domain-containing protein [Panacibacter sp. DH6]|uniref:DUF4907 domain-containing protein n=1 Tax=Panacibacter microcysteis TaxID=2793269 RepID=A0A931E279_9BACT|nr:DUF4907 domain-containing protein [Panacibacter microcysteis]MBG9374777.1 DUF4907 domain-containing protein [Panacibacter microcysteis]